MNTQATGVSTIQVFGDKNVKAFHTYASMQTVKFTTKFNITE